MVQQDRMEYSNEKRFEIERKLTKEGNNLSVLKETLQRSSQLTKGMDSILTSFEDRLGKLEQTILPVYHETKNLQQRQENVERVLAGLDYVINYYNVSKEVETVIKDGPASGFPVIVYVESINKIQTAIKYFEDNNPNSSELHNLRTLFDIAGDALEREFRSLLSRYSKPVPPVILLDIIMPDEELICEEDRVAIEHFPEKILQELKEIALWLEKNKREDYMNVYATIRSSILAKSLQGLKDHFKSTSGGSHILPVHSSPAMSRARVKDTPTRKTSRKLQQALMNKGKKIINFSQTVEQAAGFALGHRRQGSSLEPKDDVLDAEMESYQTCITALLKLMQSELQLMQDIIPVKSHQRQIFERIIHLALDHIVQDGENIATRAKKCVGRHDFSSALAVFPIMKHLVLIKPEFDRLLEGCQPSIRNKFAALIASLHSMGAKALDDFVDSIKTDPDRQMPKDGTVHELTSNVLMFLEQLLDYTDTIGGRLAEDPLYRSSLSQVNESNRSKVAVGIFVGRVLNMLNLTLNNKSEAYSDVYLKSIFRLNNLHYILKALQRSGLLEVVHLHNREMEDHYNDLILEQKRLYSQSWSRVLHYVMEIDKPLSPPGFTNKLKDKDRQNIKDKFTGFNKEMDDIFKVQKGYAIPDVELRESLKRDNKEFILPNYQTFYNKYIHISFTKNPDKYIKLKPSDVSDLLDKFFDVAA